MLLHIISKVPLICFLFVLCLGCGIPQYSVETRYDQFGSAQHVMLWNMVDRSRIMVILFDRCNNNTGDQP